MVFATVDTGLTAPAIGARVLMTVFATGATAPVTGGWVLATVVVTGATVLVAGACVVADVGVDAAGGVDADGAVTAVGASDLTVLETIRVTGPVAVLVRLPVAAGVLGARVEPVSVELEPVERVPVERGAVELEPVEVVPVGEAEGLTWEPVAPAEGEAGLAVAAGDGVGAVDGVADGVGLGADAAGAEAAPTVEVTVEVAEVAEVAALVTGDVAVPTVEVTDDAAVVSVEEAVDPVDVWVDVRGDRAAVAACAGRENSSMTTRIPAAASAACTAERAMRRTIGCMSSSHSTRNQVARLPPAAGQTSHTRNRCSVTTVHSDR
jgi:hypothetical protein